MHHLAYILWEMWPEPPQSPQMQNSFSELISIVATFAKMLKSQDVFTANLAVTYQCINSTCLVDVF